MFWCGNLADAVQRRIAQVDVAARPCRSSRAAFSRRRRIRPRACAEQIEIFLDAALAIRRIAARLGQRAAVCAHLVGGEVADEGLAVADQFQRAQIEHLEIIRGVAQRVPVEAEPAHVVLDRLDEFDVFLGRVGVVEAQIADAAVISRRCRNSGRSTWRGRDADSRSARAESASPTRPPCLPAARSSVTIWRMKLLLTGVSLLILLWFCAALRPFVAKVPKYTDKPVENEWGAALPARAECASVTAKARKGCA